MVIAASSVAASNSSVLEGKALLENGWWSGESTDMSLNHCMWFGIKCNDGRSAIEIDMARVDPVFYLGDEGDEFSKHNFSSFPNLVPLNVSYYGLRGSIPVEIGTLSKLTHLDLSHYYLTGELPLSLENLKNLLELDLDTTNLIGVLSLSLANLTQLLTFDISSNHLGGSIPIVLGNIKNLLELGLGGNYFNGFIRIEIRCNCYPNLFC